MREIKWDRFRIAEQMSPYQENTWIINVVRIADGVMVTWSILARDILRELIHFFNAPSAIQK